MACLPLIVEYARFKYILEMYIANIFFFFVANLFILLILYFKAQQGQILITSDFSVFIFLVITLFVSKKH